MMTHITDKADDEAIWARIDRALGLIEAAVRHAPPEPPAEDADLAARHAALRAAVVTAIGQIDTLIEAQSGAHANPLNDVFAAFHPANEEPA